MSRPPARILLVEMNEDGTVGGSHQAQFDLVRHLDRSRFRPVVVFYQDNRFAREMREMGVEVHVLEELRRRELELRRGGGTLQRGLDILAGAVLRRRRLIREFGAELVHLNNSPGTGADDWLPASRLAGVPCVTFAMGNTPRGLGAIHESLARRFDRILVISDFVRRSLLEVGYPAALLSMTQIGVDLEEFRGRVRRTRDEVRSDLGIPDDRVVACMVGNLREWKGQHVVLEALSHLPEAARRSLLVLFVGAVGPSFQGYADRLQALVREHALEDGVRFLGGRTDIPDLLGASDLGLHASVLPEPFGLVVVEAMAMGLPVVATSIGAPGGVVVPGAGRTFDPADPPALAEALRELVDDPNLRKKLGEGARARAEAFDARQMVEAVENVYADLLGRR